MKMAKKGFTLIELVVVVLILGILASIAIPGYRKSVETSRAGDAQGMLNAIATGNRMYFMDRSAYCCTTGSQLSSSNPLVSNKYIADAGWAQLSYDFFSCMGNNTGSGRTGGTVTNCCTTGSPIACAIRKPGFEPYSSWTYRIDSNGNCSNSNGAPGCAGM